MNYQKLYLNRRVALTVCASVLSIGLLSGCKDAKNAEGLTDDLATAKTESGLNADDDYAKFIHDALESASKDSTEAIPAEPFEDEPGRVIHVNSKGDNEPVYVSASDEAPDEYDVEPENDIDDDENLPDMPPSTGDRATNSVPTPTPSESAESTMTTPDTFDVGTCCIYINGENDSAFGSDIVTAINKARTDLGYKALEEKTGLNTCADRRTREIACYLNHTRPNMQPFYSLAPQYFKAEMLAIDNATAAETVDAWIRDITSRNLVFTTKYSSVGAACFKCNGLKCIVVAFGY